MFVSVKACDAELPTSKLPKLKLLALAESKKVCAGLEFVVPVPETPTEICPPPLWPGVIMMLPLKVAAASGLNTTWKDALLRGARNMGIAGTSTINSGRLLVTC